MELKAAVVEHLLGLSTLAVRKAVVAGLPVVSAVVDVHSLAVYHHQELQNGLVA